MKYCLILLSILLFFSSCKTSNYIYEDENLRIEIEIKKNNKIDENTYKLKSSVKVKNLTENLCQFDLRKIELQTANNVSYAVYIDSISSRLIEVQKIQPHKDYTENIYWILNSSNDPIIQGINYSLSE
ncbi:hypothetical protein [Treponema sp.]|uniref:hypothetical protein n=1 Tax=Treponema sp. TaxID=166 RepID=UPI00388E997F